MLTGLTAAEAAERTRRGEINRLPRTRTRDYLAILARNLFTGFKICCQRIFFLVITYTFITAVYINYMKCFCMFNNKISTAR